MTLILPRMLIDTMLKMDSRHPSTRRRRDIIRCRLAPEQTPQPTWQGFCLVASAGSGTNLLKAGGKCDTMDAQKVPPSEVRVTH